MIHLKRYSGDSTNDCLKQVSEEIPDDKIINVIPRGSKEFHGFDEYDFWETYYVDVIYKD